MDFPITLEQFLTVFGIGLFAALFTQFLKPYIRRRVEDEAVADLWVNGVCFVLCIVIAVVAQLILLQWQIVAQKLFEAGLVGFFGFFLATGGYEGLKNLFAFLGKTE